MHFPRAVIGNGRDPANAGEEGPPSMICADVSSEQVKSLIWKGVGVGGVGGA
jgi:hypothetical protein